MSKPDVFLSILVNYDVLSDVFDLYSASLSSPTFSVNASHWLRISMWNLFLFDLLAAAIYFFSHRWFVHDLVSAWLNLSIFCHESWSNQVIGSHCLSIKFFHLIKSISYFCDWNCEIGIFCWYRNLLIGKALGLNLYPWYLFINLGHFGSIPRIQATSGLLFAWDSWF